MSAPGVPRIPLSDEWAFVMGVVVRPPGIAAQLRRS